MKIGLSWARLSTRPFSLLLATLRGKVEAPEELHPGRYRLLRGRQRSHLYASLWVDAIVLLEQTPKGPPAAS
jgi:hypothetical protein